MGTVILCEWEVPWININFTSKDINTSMSYEWIKQASIYLELYQCNQGQNRLCGLGCGYTCCEYSVNWKSCCNQDVPTEPEPELLHHLCSKDSWTHGQSHLHKTCISLREDFRTNFHATDHFQIYNQFYRASYAASHTKRERAMKRVSFKDKVPVSSHSMSLVWRCLLRFLIR